MKPTSDLYEDIAVVYTRLVRQESQEAAAAIEHVHSTFGARAALRAALIITIMKTEIQENHWIPGIGLYAHLLEDYPQALPLTRHAMKCCLQKWEGSLLEPGGWAESAVA